MKKTLTTAVVILLIMTPVLKAGDSNAKLAREEKHEAMLKQREEKREAMKAKLAEFQEEKKAKVAERKKIEERKRTEYMEALEKKRAEYRERIARTQATEFEKKNSDKDLLRGKITHSMPSNNGDSDYMAFILLRWGDLDNKIPNCKSEYYSNWDGYVKVQQGGKAGVVKEFAFDDRNTRTGGVDKGDGIGRDSGKKRAVPNEPGEGSGHDHIIKDTESSMVAWKSGIVGATDGLLIRLDLKKPETRGTIKAGNFTIPYEITPRPEQVKPASSKHSSTKATEKSESDTETTEK